MHKSEYIEYLKSEDWKIRRKYLMELADWTCSICGNKATQLHHLKYDKLGDEELDVDVIPLCNNCHKKIHEENGYEEYTAYG